MRAPPILQPGCLIQAGPRDPGQASPPWDFAGAILLGWGGEGRGTLLPGLQKAGSRGSFYQMGTPA